MKRGQLLRRTEIKPGKPLQRHTPLTATTSLTGQSQPLRRTPLNPVSAKRRKTNRERTEVLRPLRAEQTWCSRCGVTGVGLDAHELLSRARGGSTTDLTNIVLLCRCCHDDVTFRHHQIPDADQWVLSRKDAA